MNIDTISAAFQNIGSSVGPVSVPEEIFREYTKGGLPMADYHTMTAAWVAANTDHYRPRVYPVMPDSLRNYVHERVVEKRDRDEVYHRQIGLWVFNTLKLKEQNDADLLLLLWCCEKIGDQAIAGALEKLQSRIDQYSRFHFPMNLFSTASKAQSMDTAVKTRRN